MNQQLKTPESRPNETARLEAFSDGVFAIAITLLVLELIQSFKRIAGASLLQSILHHWEPSLAFVIGFITILVCWINHHHALNYIKRVDGPFLWVNGFLLFMVTVTPFPTAILAESLSTESKSALALFGFNYILIAIAAWGICAYAYRYKLIDESARPIFKYITRSYAYSILYTMAALGVCFISITLAILMYILLFAAFALPDLLVQKISILQRPRPKPVRLKKSVSS